MHAGRVFNCWMGIRRGIKGGDHRVLFSFFGTFWSFDF